MFYRLLNYIDRFYFQKYVKQEVNLRKNLHSEDGKEELLTLVDIASDKRRRRDCLEEE